MCCIIHDVTERLAAEKALKEYQRHLRSLSSQLTLAEEKERRKLAVDLHDQVGQTLVLSQFKLRKLKDNVDVPLHRDINEILSLITSCIQDTRYLAFELSPPVLYELGLGAALEWLTDRFQQQTKLSVRYREQGSIKDINSENSIILYRASREVLFNAFKHASATMIDLSLSYFPEFVQVSIKDNGIGILDSKINKLFTTGLGLFSIRERLRVKGGVIRVRSWPGKGTQITMTIPLDNENVNQNDKPVTLRLN